MKLGYTEFSFGYAFTENMIRSSSTRPSSAPVFPNLIQEAQLGFDVKIDQPGAPLFFQYKLPERMVRDTAAEIAFYEIEGWSAPFFRMPIMKRSLSNQHWLLMELEKKYPQAVFYASPCLDDAEQFNSAYNRVAVHLRSALFSPLEIGPLPDNKQHNVAYSPKKNEAWFCSKPRRIKMHLFENLEQQILQKDSERIIYTDLDNLTNAVQERLRPLVPNPLRFAEGEIRERLFASVDRILEADDLAGEMFERRRVVVELLVCREFARIGLGLDMLIAQQS